MKLICRHMIELLRGCGHSRLSFPQGKPGACPHVTCLECGKEYSYLWDQMRVGEAVRVEGGK